MSWRGGRRPKELSREEPKEPSREEPKEPSRKESEKEEPKEPSREESEKKVEKRIDSITEAYSCYVIFFNNNILGHLYRILMNDLKDCKDKLDKGRMSKNASNTNVSMIETAIKDLRTDVNTDVRERTAVDERGQYTYKGSKTYMRIMDALKADPGSDFYKNPYPFLYRVVLHTDTVKEHTSGTHSVDEG